MAQKLAGGPITTAVPVQTEPEAYLLRLYGQKFFKIFSTIIVGLNKWM